MNRSDMSLQDIFNTVYKGLREQGFKKSMDGCACAYRDAEGRKCAAGFLITDEEYSSEMEGMGILTLNMQCDLGFSSEQVYFIADLQSDHDSSPGPQNMRLCLEQRARVRNLSIPA